MHEIRNGRNLQQNWGGPRMNDFKLPVINELRAQKRILSMDEYLQFVQFNLKHTLDRKAYEKWKKMLIVNVPFSMA